MSIVRELPTVLQLDIAGNPQQWINFEDSCYHFAKGNVAWSMGEVDFDVHGGTCAVTGERTVLSINTIIAIRGELNDKAMRHYNRVPLTNKTLFRRDHHMCGYCGNTYASHKLSRDHIVPSSRGGANKWENVVTSCEPCNKMKDDNLLHEIGMKLLYVPHVPNRAEWLLLKNKKVLADQMEFLLKRVPKDSRFHNM